MAAQMQKVISSYEQCIQHESIHAKVPVQLIIVTTPLELLHVILAALRQWWSWIKPQTWWNFWSFVTILQNTPWHMWSPDQTAKTVAKYLWQGYVLIFRALAKLLSDQGANVESNIIRELCEFMGIWKARTSPYHAQSNGQIEWVHQMLMHMIGKLSRTRKQTGQSICLSWCMLTIPQDQPSSDTACII